MPVRMSIRMPICMSVCSTEPPGNKPAGNKPAGNKPAGNKTAGNKTAGNKTAGNGTGELEEKLREVKGKFDSALAVVKAAIGVFRASVHFGKRELLRFGNAHHTYQALWLGVWKARVETVTDVCALVHARP